jgi:hypothetical protein
MWKTYLKVISIFLCILILTSCSSHLRTLRSDKIPSEVGQYFKEIKSDSSGALQADPFRYETDTYIYIFKLKAMLINGKVKGVLIEKRFPKPYSSLPTEGIIEKKFTITLKSKLCCSNHTPNDCVNNKQEASDSSRKKGCARWKAITL